MSGLCLRWAAPAVLLVWAGSVRAQPAAPLSPTVYASPIHAGCKSFGPSRCQVVAEPFTIHVSTGQRLTAFQIWIDGVPVYDFRTDVSNPPAGNYTPSRVKLGFAARCSTAHTVRLIGRDSGDGTYFLLGQTASVTCPAPLLPVGDANGDGSVNVADVIHLINLLFAGGAQPVGDGDVNGDGLVDVGDVLYLISYLFAGGAAPV